MRLTPFSVSQPANDGFDIIDAAAPGAAAGLLERGPEPRIVGQGRRRREVFAGGSLAQNRRAFFGGKALRSFADEVDCSGQLLAIHKDANPIPIAQFANW